MSIRKFCNVAYKHGTYMIKYKPNKLCLLFFNHDNIMNIVYAKSTILKVISNIRQKKPQKPVVLVTWIGKIRVGRSVL